MSSLLLQTFLGNGTNPPALSSLPSTVLDTFIPGYGSIHKFFLFVFGFDITTVVSLGIVFWLGSKLVNYIWTIARILITQNYMSSIHVNSYDDIYVYLMKWLAEQSTIKTSRSLMAETNWKNAWEADEDDVEELLETDAAKNGGIYCLNFANREAKAPPRFIPAFGTHRLWFKGRLFTVARQNQTVQDSNGISPILTQKEDLIISCFGRSTQPVKELLQEAKDLYYQSHESKTVIRRPAVKDIRRFGGRNCWTQIAHRPCRPMATVVLDAQRKREVLADMNEFLHPATARWYSNRGIPYRRGYLFHGPPGTGKTSLSFALAGVFGLNIYVVSLLEPSLTEEDLEHLFNSLPRRCIVLLEDIDSAGLTREKDADEAGGEAGLVDDLKINDLARVLKGARAGDVDEKKHISLSGLLNTIDGVASHEGRVLVMTTNHPEKLDEALIRPGRVDLQVPFGNATHAQITELFLRMYSALDLPALPPPIPAPTTAAAAAALSKSRTTTISVAAPTHPDGLTPPSTPTDAIAGRTMARDGGDDDEDADEHDAAADTLIAVAHQFAAAIPSGEFSPAEIQGFLLKRKQSPRKALSDVAGWVAAVAGVKRARTQVLDVQ